MHMFCCIIFISQTLNVSDQCPYIYNDYAVWGWDHSCVLSILFQPKIFKWNIYIFKIGNQAPKISILINTIKESIPLGVDRAKIQQWIDLKWPETKL